MSTNSSSDEPSRAVVVMSSREVSHELIEMLPIRGIDTCTKEEIEIAGYEGLRLVGNRSVGAGSDFADIWAAQDVSSIVSKVDLDSLRQTFRVLADICFYILEPHERACVPREGCVALHVQSFNSGMSLPLDLFYRHGLRVYGLAPTQVTPNGFEMPPIVFVVQALHRV
ncbi:Uncharacterized protein Adt_05633 [Abeliophyllum distichum]|uniref:Uncharacterized protein n=1 Tax=Abeliophyllum distichum TaxID=126358 RepID=A0ABD1V4X2_9LAMI